MKRHKRCITSNPSVRSKKEHYHCNDATRKLSAFPRFMGQKTIQMDNEKKKSNDKKPGHASEQFHIRGKIAKTWPSEYHGTSNDSNHSKRYGQKVNKKPALPANRPKQHFGEETAAEDAEYFLFLMRVLCFLSHLDDLVIFLRRLRRFFFSRRCDSFVFSTPFTMHSVWKESRRINLRNVRSLHQPA